MDIVEYYQIEIGQIDGKKVLLTNHAIERLKERLSKLDRGQTPKKPGKTAIRLWKQTTEENLDPVIKVKRLINNNGRDARYFSFNGWRFVLVEYEDCFKVKTIERNYYAA